MGIPVPQTHAFHQSFLASASLKSMLLGQASMSPFVPCGCEASHLLIPINQGGAKNQVPTCLRSHHLRGLPWRMKTNPPGST